MLNFYSCGCTSPDDIPILSRCGEHNGYIVATVRDTVTNKQSFRVNDLRIRHHKIEDTLTTLIEKKVKFDLICSYPEHATLYAYNSLESGWRKKVNPLFKMLNSVMKSDGHMLLVVEQTLLARALYDLTMSDFEINSITIVSSRIAYEPYHTKWEEFYAYKFAILVSKYGTGVVLPEYIPMAKLHNILKKKLRPATVLETSCIHTPFLTISDKTVGVCENYNRYSKLRSTYLVNDEQ